MKLKIDRSELLRILAHTAQVSTSRSAIPILENVMLGAKDGSLTATSTNLDQQISDSAVATIETEGSITVPRKAFYDLIRKTGADSRVSLDLNGGKLRVRAGRSQFDLSTLPADDFPLIAPEELPMRIEMNAEAVEAAFQKVRHAQSSEETRYYLNGIFLHLSDGKLFAVATDGHRLSRALIDANISGNPADFIIPRTAVAQIERIIPSTDEIILQASGKKVRLEAGTVTLDSKLIDGTYPDYQRVIPEANKISVTTCPRALSAALTRVTTVSSDKTRAVTLDISGQKISLSVITPDRASAHDEVDAVSNDEIRIGANASYLGDILAQIRSEEVQMLFADPASPILIREPGNTVECQVLMPMRT